MAVLNNDLLSYFDFGKNVLFSRRSSIDRLISFLTCSFSSSVNLGAALVSSLFSLFFVVVVVVAFGFLVPDMMVCFVFFAVEVALAGLAFTDFGAIGSWNSRRNYMANEGRRNWMLGRTRSKWIVKHQINNSEKRKI